MSRRERWLAIVIALLVVGFGADQFIIGPLLRHFKTMDERIATVDKQYQHARMLVSNRQTLNERWQSYQQSGLAAEESALRLKVQQSLTEWSKQAGLNLTTLTSGRMLEDERFQKMQFIATGTGSMRSVVTFLASVQTGSFPLRIVGFDLSSRNEATDLLTLRLTLSVIRLTDTTAGVEALVSTEMQP